MNSIAIDAPASEELDLPITEALAGTEYGLVQAHGFAALITLILSALFGTAVAIKFVLPNFLGGEPWATWGLLRYNHTQGIMFGWLGNAFLAFLYFATPRLSGSPVTGRRLGWTLFALWIRACHVVCTGG